MARTTDDLYDKLDELIDAISDGGGISRGRGISSNYKNMDEYNASIEEIKHRYEVEEKLSGDLETRKKKTYKEEIKRLEDKRKQNEDLLKDLFDQNEDFEKRKDSLTEDEKKKYEENLERIKTIGAANERNYKEELDYRKKLNEASGFGATIKDLDTVVKKVKGVYGEITKLTEPWAKADHAVSQYAKTIGLAQKGMRNLRRDTLLALTRDNLAAKYNINAEELIEAQSNYVKGIGRNVRISTEDQENMAAMRAVTGGKGTELASLYENFGVNMSDTADHVGRMFSEASKEGLVFEAYAENVSKNIKIAQNYTFTNGLKGLESMAKKATALKLDMQQVAALADNVSTVEGAIDVSSKLQVLGGPFAQLADPMGMLNEGLNDMEGLQDRLIKMISGMGSFDKSTGEVKVSSFNKVRIKEAAKAMGISEDNLLESVNAHAKRGEIDKQISASATASALPEEMKELIRNSGTFKDGKAGVSIRGQFKSLDELSGDDYEALQKETQTESQDIKDIAMDLRSIKDMREGVDKSAESWQARVYAPVANIEKGITNMVGELMNVIGPSVAVIKGVLIAGNIAQMFNGKLGNIFREKMGGSGNSIKDKAEDTIKDIVGDKLGDKVKDIVGDKVKDKAEDKIKDIVGDKVKDKAEDKIKDIVGDKLGDKVKDIVGDKLGDKVKDIVGDKVKDIVGDKIKGKVGKGASTKILGGVAKSGSSALGGLAAGAGALAGGAALYSIGNNLDKKTEAAIAEGRMEKGGTKHTLSKTGTSAMKGAGIGLGAAGAAGMVSAGATMLGASALATGIGSALGAIGGPIGMAIGAAVVGGVVGLVKSAKAKNEVIVDEQLKALGVERKGKYGIGKLKKIDKALQTGELSDKMRRKLIRKGDIEIVKEIEKVKEQKEAKKKEKEEIRKIKLKTANITIGSANISGIDFSKGFGKRKRIKLGDRIDKGISIVKGYKEDGLSGAWEAIRGRKSAFERAREKAKEGGLQKDFNININGSLKLTGDNGQSVDIIGELRKNPQLLRSLADMISKEINYLDKNTNVVQKA